MIDIIIPTYHPGDYFFDCLRSLQNQKLPFDKFKVTIVLNGDKEPYYSKIEEYLNQFSFIFSLIHTEIKGVSNARNMGIEKTEFPYIIFLDDDDVLSENYLIEILSRRKNKSIVVSNVLSFKNNLNSCSNDYLSFDKPFQSENLVKYRKYLSNSCCKLIPRDMIGSLRFNPHFFKGEDALFMFTLSRHIKSIISTEPDVIYYRRLRPFSASRGKYSISKELKISLQQQVGYSRVFFRNFGNYNFILYVTRMLAVLKVFFMKIKG